MGGTSLCAKKFVVVFWCFLLFFAGFSLLSVIVAVSVADILVKLLEAGGLRVIHRREKLEIYCCVKIFTR